KPLAIYVAAAGKLVEEKEPNDGFKVAQSAASGFSISGVLSQAADVDVFKVTAKASQKIRVEVIAAQVGSILDGSVTVYDSKGAITASNDDTVGRDPALTQKVAADGDYFIALTCVNELPAKTSAPYVIKVSIDP
ncbi:MAG: PPC domain-containing protein, partial [Opitutaceae bacterium]|nr:PPC domain-containing protein [Verrucomicrobiales bacterium]